MYFLISRAHCVVNASQKYSKNIYIVWWSFERLTFFICRTKQKFKLFSRKARATISICSKSNRYTTLIKHCTYYIVYISCWLRWNDIANNQWRIKQNNDVKIHIIEQQNTKYKIKTKIHYYTSILQRKHNVSYLSLLKIVIIAKKNRKRTRFFFNYSSKH